MLDTNVLIAGVFARGLCEAVLEAWIEEGRFVVVLSEYILDEFARVARDKFDATADAASRSTALFRDHAEIVSPAPVDEGACGDRADLPILGTALAGRADMLVTGDKRLLALGKFNAIPIVSPRDLVLGLR